MTDPVVVDSSLLIFGGPYSNLEATEAVLAEALRRGIPPECTVCTGDVVAYGADARATVDTVRRAGVHVVMGNCEESLAAGAGDCGCGFTPGSVCDRLSSAWYAHADRELGPEERAWMGALPRRLDLEINDLRLAVVHGSVTEINRFVFASTRARLKAIELDAAGTDGVVAGHCGLPLTQVIGGRLWHNAGATGMPANDGTTRVWFSVLTPGPGLRTLTVEHHPITYDFESAARKMRAAKLPEDYASALETGLWPSCDVLPAAELEARGVPFTLGTTVWRREAPGTDLVH